MTPVAGFLWGLTVGLSVGVAAIYVTQLTGEPLFGWALFAIAITARVRFGGALRAWLEKLDQRSG